MLFYPVYQHAVCHGILAALGHDYVGVLFAWLNECLVHRLNGGQILRYDRIKRPSALLHVAHDTAQNADVGIGIHEYLHIESFYKLAVLEYEYTLEYYNA